MCPRDSLVPGAGFLVPGSVLRVQGSVRGSGFGSGFGVRGSRLSSHRTTGRLWTRTSNLEPGTEPRTSNLEPNLEPGTAPRTRNRTLTPEPNPEPGTRHPEPQGVSA